MQLCSEKNECVDFKFNGINVKSMDEVKLFGVNIDKKLNFDSHVSYLCKKTSRQVNALSRLRHIANENSKNMLYKTYIMSNFNYCSAIWNYCSSKSIIKLEKLNKRALRIVLNDDKCTYHDLLRISQNICLFSMRRECIMKTVFKCTHNIAPSYLRDLFKVRNERMITRSKTYLIQPMGPIDPPCTPPPPQERMRPILFCSWDLSEHEKWMPPSPNWDGLPVGRHFQNGRHRN